MKHRSNKNQKQRVVVFIARYVYAFYQKNLCIISPIFEDEKTLETLGKKLKKNGVAVDIVNMEFSNQEQNQKLQKFIEAVNSSDNRYYSLK